jgi:hypothetical protein
MWVTNFGYLHSTLNPEAEYFTETFVPANKSIFIYSQITLVETSKHLFFVFLLMFLSLMVFPFSGMAHLEKT